MTVVIVESPAKAKTINKYLGQGYEVVASFGHVRDLPSKNGSVDPEHGFAMVWEMDKDATKRINQIAKSVKADGKLLLATDPDREGEAISWHLYDILNQKKALKGVDVKRITFNSVTKDSILQAIDNPRDIDQALVDAYLARRALDYLVGFNISPVLWRKLPGARSAGRVQSVALRLVCEREQDIERFVSFDYYSIVAGLKTAQDAMFDARLVGVDGDKVGRYDLRDKEQAEQIQQHLERSRYNITSVEKKPVKRNPYAPFTTSTLQMESSRKLGFSPQRTMQLAQKLYEGIQLDGETTGLITYMRTDGVQMSPAAIDATRQAISSQFSEQYLPEKPRIYTSKAKNAQEAHEAIRPTDPARAPRMVSRFLEPDLFKLYELIWKRTLASQMQSATLERTTIDILAQAEARRFDLRASGDVIVFDGFLTLYTETSDDDDDEDNAVLPAVEAGQSLGVQLVTLNSHTTEPPPRYSEATLIKRMEELGIGRPSTYASILSVIRDRGYVALEKKRLVPEAKGRIVTAFLENYFSRYVEYDFTAQLENDLDLISDSQLNWQDFLGQFWLNFTATLNESKDLTITDVINQLEEDLANYIFPHGVGSGDGQEGAARQCPTCGTGTLNLKLSKYGGFVGCSNYPECNYTRQLTGNADNPMADDSANQDIVLGQNDEGLDVVVKSGRFGPYVQLGAGKEAKRASLPKGMTKENMTLDDALKLLILPRLVGKHPETGEDILANLGRYGPYVQHGKTYASVESYEDLFTIGINRAVDLIANKQSGKGSSARGAKVELTLGEHPNSGKTLEIKSGRYGMYITDGKTNAPMPKGKKPEDLTLSEAAELIDAREKNPPQKRGRSSTKAKKSA